MRKSLAINVSMIALALSILSFVRFGQVRKDTNDFPDGTFWLCQGDNHEFVMSIDELGAWYAKNNGNPLCPKCGNQNTTRAFRCTQKDCRRFFVTAIALHAKAACPVCKRELTQMSP